VRGLWALGALIHMVVQSNWGQLVRIVRRSTAAELDRIQFVQAVYFLFNALNVVVNQWFELVLKGNSKTYQQDCSGYLGANFRSF
jgi:hypothetical protein